MNGMDGKAFAKAVNKVVAPVAQQLKNKILLGILTALDDSGPVQLVQASILADEAKAAINRPQNYGFYSNPIPKDTTEVVLVSVLGKDHMLAMVVDDPEGHVPDRAPGDVYMRDAVHGNEVWIDTENNKVKVVATGTVDVVAVGKITLQSQTQIHLDAPSITTSCGTICP